MSGKNEALARAKRLAGFVIEARIREGSEKESDTPRYHWHWYGGIAVHPGTGEWNAKAGKFIEPVIGGFWSPHFSDAHVFASMDAAQAEIAKIIGPTIGAVAVPIEKSHFAESWS